MTTCEDLYKEMENWLERQHSASDKRRCMEDDCRYVHRRLHGRTWKHADFIVRVFSEYIAKRYRRDVKMVRHLIENFYDLDVEFTTQHGLSGTVEHEPIRKDRW